MAGDKPRQPAARPELISLDAAARDRVTELIAAKGGHCEACGASEFAIGGAMSMGFLFLDEDADSTPANFIITARIGLVSNSVTVTF